MVLFCFTKWFFETGRLNLTNTVVLAFSYVVIHFLCCTLFVFLESFILWDIWREIVTEISWKPVGEMMSLLLQRWGLGEAWGIDEAGQARWVSSAGTQPAFRDSIRVGWAWTLLNSWQHVTSHRTVLRLKWSESRYIPLGRCFSRVCDLIK